LSERQTDERERESQFTRTFKKQQQQPNQTKLKEKNNVIIIIITNDFWISSKIGNAHTPKRLAERSSNLTSKLLRHTLLIYKTKYDSILRGDIV
jgi:hypothetical protein